MESKFSASDLDAFINEVTINKNDVVQFDNNDMPIVKPEETTKALTDYTPETIYKQISELVDTGNRMLKTSLYALEMDPLAEGGASGAAAVLSAVKDVTKEFTKIHFQNLKHMQSIELERIKQENREKLLRVKIEAMNGTMKQVEEMVPYCQEDVVRMILNNNSENE